MDDVMPELFVGMDVGVSEGDCVGGVVGSGLGARDGDPVMHVISSR